MKSTSVRVAVASAFIFAQAGAALAAWDDTPGRGLGSMVSEKEPKSLFSPYHRATLNIQSSPLATSSGTSGCANNGMTVKEEQTAMFSSPTVESFSQEIAQGHGEHLAWLATLLGVPSELQPRFFSLAQVHYRELMQAGDSSPQAMVTALEQAISILPTASKNPLMLLGKAEL